MRVEELMTETAVTCRPEDDLATAASKMWDSDCGAIPVIDEAGVPCGMITDRDACMAAYMRGLPLAFIKVHEAMSNQVHAVRRDQTASEAEEIMARAQVRRVPVLDDDGKPCGMLSVNDLVREAARPATRLDGGAIKVVQTLAAISRPRTPQPERREPPPKPDSHPQPPPQPQPRARNAAR